jgi:hypothetical protein
VKVVDSGRFVDDTTSLLDARTNPKYSGKELAPQWTADQLAEAKGFLQARGAPTDSDSLDAWLRNRAGLPQKVAPPPGAPARSAPIQPGIP